jgi:cAMP-dependent protein kinase regulator
MSEKRHLSFLDRAYSLWLRGNSEQALKIACSILVANNEDLGAAYLIARILAEANRDKTIAEVAKSLVEMNIRRGNLPGACLAAQVGIGVGLSASLLFRNIAEAFGKGSTRIGDVAPRPPALPVIDTEVAPYFGKLTEEALLSAAEKALKHFSEKKDSLPADTTLPKLPLYGALEPRTLEKLLALHRVRDLDAEAVAIKQGDEGKEAFTLARGVLKARRNDANGETTLAVLGPGAIFGEMALVSRAPRAASVLAEEPCEILAISREDLEKLAQEEPIIASELVSFCQSRMVSNLIRHSAFLSAVKADKRRELIEKFEMRSFECEEMIVEQGQNRADLFLIASGEVEVSSSDSDGDRVVLAQLGPGEVVGEISLVLRRPATANVIALVPTVAMVLTQERFQEVIREHPSVLSELYELAIKREEETRSVVAQKALDVDDVVLI